MAALLVIGLVLLSAGGAVFSISRSWRITIPCFILVSVGMGFSTLTLISIPFAVILSLSGCLAASVYLITILREPDSFHEEANPPVSWIFRAIFLLLVLVVVLAGGPSLGALFRDPPRPIVFGAGWLVGVGLLNLGLSDHPLRTGASLTLFLQGFTLAFLWIEQSVLLIGLLSLLYLAVAVAFSFLSLWPREEAV